MQVMYERCAALDVHKKMVVACVLTLAGQETRTFSTMTGDLLALGTLEVTCIDGLGGLNESQLLACWRSDLPVANRLPVTSPSSANLGFGKAEIVGWRINRLRPVHSHHDDLADDVRRAPLFVEGDDLVVEGSRFKHRGHALEAVAFAHELIDDVHLHLQNSVESGAMTKTFAA
jgi:hypothetical protein